MLKNIQSQFVPISVALAISVGVTTPSHAWQAVEKPDADAVAALNKMGAALRAMDNFSVEARVSNEEVLETGQKLQYDGKLVLQARRPDGFKIVMDSDHRVRELYYDGKSVTLFAPKVGYYATVAAPGTIGATLEVVKSKYGVEIPLADLFSFGVDPALLTRIKSGFDVGPETIEGANCEHYAFRQATVDWQIWIRSDGPALPCKMVITTTDDPSQPQYTAVLTWGAGPDPASGTFLFQPPANAHRITLADVSAKAK